MKTRDGVEFQLGMTLFTESDREIATSVETHEVELVTYMLDRRPHPEYHLARRGGGGGINLDQLFSSRAARYEHLIGNLAKERDKIQDRIDNLYKERDQQLTKTKQESEREEERGEHRSRVGCVDLLQGMRCTG